MKRNVVLITIFSMLALVFFNVPETFAQSKPKYGGTIKVGINTDVTELDPHKSAPFINSVVLNNVYERLIAHGDKMELVPVLAERWEMSSDLKSITFYLRKGKLFHNGREMVADDVKWSIDRLLDPKTKFKRRSSFKNLDRVEVLDKYTVRVYLKEGDTSIVYAFALISSFIVPIPREEVEKQGGTMKHPIGTGPYKFVEWKPDRYVLLERFDEYVPQPGPVNGLAGKRIAYADKLKFIPIPEESVATMALLNKEIDFLHYLPFKNVENFEKDYTKKGIVVDSVLGHSWYQIFFGLDKPITSNLKFRKACAYAIDCNVVTQAAIYGYGAVNQSLIPVVNEYYTPAHKKWYPKNLEKAKQLLKEAGYNGEEIEITTTKKYAAMYSIALAVQSELTAAGINVKLKVVEWANEVKAFYASDFQILSYGQSARPDPALAYKRMQFAGKNFHKQNPRMLEILDKATKTLDKQVRTKLFEEAQEIVYESIPMINMYNYSYFNAYWDHLKGFKIWSSNLPRFWGVWLDK